jgi:hypothetical protein
MTYLVVCSLTTDFSEKLIDEGNVTPSAQQLTPDTSHQYNELRHFAVETQFVEYNPS